MDFAFSEEQAMLRASARDYLGDRYPMDRVVALVEGDAGWDPASWPQLAELGWIGLSVTEDRGGAGMSFVDEAVLFEELGRSLYPGPFFATVALTLPVLEAAYGADPTLLDAALAGRRCATLAWAESDRPTMLAAAESARCVAAAGDGGWTLTGTKRFVPDLAIVDDVAVVARDGDGDGIGVWRVDLRADPSPAVALSTMDATRRLGELVLDATPATLLIEPGAAGRVLISVRRRALAALACEAVGVAHSALDLASGHARQREQFGRPIGAFQAVSHRIADIYVALELARSLAYWAAWCVATDDAQVAMACAAAKSAAGEAAVLATENAIQAMGGIGFTWDHPLQRYYKRAQWIASFDGFGSEQRRELAAALLDG